MSSKFGLSISDCRAIVEKVNILEYIRLLANISYEVQMYSRYNRQAEHAKGMESGWFTEVAEIQAYITSHIARLYLGEPGFSRSDAINVILSGVSGIGMDIARVLESASRRL